VVEPTPPEPAEPPAPKVVTRRRRTASRPAGPPAGAPAADGDQDGQPAASSDQPALPGVTAEDALPADAEEPVVVHVPIKKKGARKR
jgi:ribonuclease E